jgi:hypothetical protein
VNVTLEGGPIEVGDELVASSTPGKAMKAREPTKGGIIGIALSAYDGRSIPAKVHDDGVAHERGHQVMMLVQAGIGQAAVDALKADNEAMKADNEAMKADNEATKADNEAMKADNEAMKADNEAMKAALCEIRPEAVFCRH